MLYVIKLGGGAGVNIIAAAQDIARLVQHGERIVLLHGCSYIADQLAQEMGEPVRYVTSASGIRSRYTDARSLRIFLMAASLVNAELVGTLQRLGVQAIGLRGLDGNLLRGPRKDVLRVIENGRPHVLRGDFTGRVEHVNTDLLRLLLDHGYVPTIAPLALAEPIAHQTSATENEGYKAAVNVDGDRAAAAVAIALGADILVILSNVPGLLTNVHNERSLVQHLGTSEIQAYEVQATGGMRRKLMAAREALHGGVHRVVLADGRIEHPLASALAGRGTVII
jgi:acetylglutamate/LysW-gamma-L-alpha-aminoadipate kinase